MVQPPARQPAAAMCLHALLMELLLCLLGTRDRLCRRATFLCQRSFVVYGGDALISHCIWSAGYGMTQPVQSYYKPHVQMFDLGRWERRPLMNLLIDATEGTCNDICQAQVWCCPSTSPQVASLSPLASSLCVQLFLSGGLCMRNEVYDCIPDVAVLIHATDVNHNAFCEGTSHGGDICGNLDTCHRRSLWQCWLS